MNNTTLFQRITIRPIEVSLEGTAFDFAHVSQLERERPQPKPHMRFHPKEWEVLKLFFVRKAQSIKLSPADAATHMEGVASLMARHQVSPRKDGITLRKWLWERMNEELIEETATEIEFERFVVEVDADSILSKP